MNNNIENKCAILRAAIRLVEKGYTQTGIRDIAVEAGVSTGLVNHHFESKKKLAMQVLTFFWERADNWADQYADAAKEPVLYDAIATRGMNIQMMNWRYRAFYIDSLRENIFFDALTSKSNSLVDQFRRKMLVAPDPDFATLYGSILPYEVEKALILKKEEGMFQATSYEDIPLYICITAFQKIVPQEEVVAADAKAREIVAEHGEELFCDITDEEIKDFIIRRSP